MKQDKQFCGRNLVKRWTSVTIIGAVLLAFGMPGWLVLYSLTSGATGFGIKLNWTAIVAFGMLLALAFLILWLFDKLVTIRMSMQQANAAESGSLTPAALQTRGFATEGAGNTCSINNPAQVIEFSENVQHRRYVFSKDGSAVKSTLFF